MLLDEEGCVWSFGHPENGTLGHNDDGKFMQKANKVEFRYECTLFFEHITDSQFLGYVLHGLQ
jgi:hypothetical protein